MSETPDPKRPAAEQQPPSPADEAKPEDDERDEDAYSSDEEAEVAARLESLGYM
jgi:hypothetical protein